MGESSKPGESRKPVIGLVGGIGAGKSWVARQFAALGCAVFDADAVAQRVLDEPEIRQVLVNWWGPGVVGVDGRVDRAAVARIVFEQPEALERLEGLVHPRVLQERRRLIQEWQRDPSVVAIVDDTPLLMEKGLDRECDVIVYVAAEESVRRRRLALQRGWSAGELERREKRQLALDMKARRADYCIDNSTDDSCCFEQVRWILSQIIAKTSAVERQGVSRDEPGRLAGNTGASCGSEGPGGGAEV